MAAVAISPKLGAIAVSTPSTSSAADDTQRAAMANLLDLNPESWSSIKGLMAMLALPAFSSGGRALVEVEVAPDVWQAIDRVSVTMHHITVSSGVNGHRHEWGFPIAADGKTPRWRTGWPAPSLALPGDNGAR